MGSDSGSVGMVMWTHIGDLNSALWENSKKPLSSTILTEASFNDDNDDDDDDDDDDDSNEETLNVNKAF